VTPKKPFAHKPAATTGVEEQKNAGSSPLIASDFIGLKVEAEDALGVATSCSEGDVC